MLKREPGALKVIELLNVLCSMVQLLQPTLFRPLALTSGHDLWPCLY